MHYVKVKGILSAQNGMNLYRGCTHGCIYCDSRSDCYRVAHAFEDIAVKENALVLLEHALRHKKKRCMLATGSMSDPYLPEEQVLGYTRKMLELVYTYGFGITIQTKSSLVLRDLDLLKKIQEQTKCVVQMTLTTYDETLCRKIEPNVSTTFERFETLKQLHNAGIPTMVWLTPILPFLNDTQENIAGILDYCTAARVYGVVCFGMGVTLRSGNREYFYHQLDRLFPQLKERYIRTFGMQYIVKSPNEAALMHYFTHRCAQDGLVYDPEKIFAYLHAFEDRHIGQQLKLF